MAIKCMRSHSRLWFSDLLCYHSGDLNEGLTLLLNGNKNNIPILLHPSKHLALAPRPPLKGHTAQCEGAQVCPGPRRAWWLTAARPLPPLAANQPSPPWPPPLRCAHLFPAVTLTDDLPFCLSYSPRPPVPPSTSMLSTSPSSRWPEVCWPTLRALPYLWLTSLETSAGPSPHTSRHIGQSAPSVKALDVFACGGPVLLWRGACAGGGFWGHSEGHVSADRACAVAQTSRRGSCPSRGLHPNTNCRSHMASTVYRGMTDWQLIIPTQLTLNWQLLSVQHNSLVFFFSWMLLTEDIYCLLAEID